MYLIISWFYSLGNISGIVPEPKQKNRKTEFSREIQEEILHMDSAFLFFSFSVFFLFFSFAYGTIPEYLRRNWKTEKLNFPERSRKRFSIWIQFFCFSVFQFFSFAYGTIPEYFRRHFGIFAEKLKNRKTESIWRISSWISLGNSVFQFPRKYSEMSPEIFRNSSVSKTEKLKNRIFQRDPGRDSPYGFSFSVLLTDLFRNISGDISEYLRGNRKTEKLNFPESSRKRISIWIQFFCFSILWQNRAGGTG